MPHLAGIRIYPIKSLDPAKLRTVPVLPSGALTHDREWALRDAEGRFVNAKREAQIHRLRVTWDLDTETVCLRAEGSEHVSSFSLSRQRPALEGWLSRFFDHPITLDRDMSGGFPDDLAAPGPTVISTATLEEVASWYPGLSVEETRTRFRANLEIGGVPAFWEDQLYGEAGDTVPFQIGTVRISGVNPCQRCIVPTRDSHSAQPLPEFAQIFRTRREETLPAWANRSRFNHFYRLAVNTRIAASESGKSLHLGDSVSIDRGRD